jgi:hypothetical protein
VLALTTGRPLFTADRYTVDGISGRVRSFVDWNDPTHELVQINASYQVPIPTAIAGFNGKLVASFSSHVYQSNRPAISFSYASDGVSCERLFLAAAPVAPATYNVADATTFTLATGFQGYWSVDGFGQNMPNGTSQVYQEPLLGGLVVGAATPIFVRHENAVSPQWEIRKGSVLLKSGNYAAPCGTTADQPLTLGANSFPVPSALPAAMSWAAWGLFPALTTVQRATVQAWMQSEYGVVP